ncbi:MAG: translation factor [Zetaproteobacteria bacterium]|nr:MAG: translation factor [Zetaproteobacteria bacterium]
MKAAKVLQQGGVIAHQTSTLAGIAASPLCSAAVTKVQRFKQRQAPFLLLADSKKTALQQAVYISKDLRKLAQTSWAGAVTLVFKARKYLHPACYQGGYIAVRVDSDGQTRSLAKACGGLMLSSSLNRKGKMVMPLHNRTRFRYHRHINVVLPSAKPTGGNASSIHKITGKKVVQLR